MNWSESELVSYWREVILKVRMIREIDDDNMVFGARSARGGHQYSFSPIVKDRDLLEFERRNRLSLPPSYRAFLQVCGSGGAGPNYGIADFCKNVFPGSFDKPFPYTGNVRVFR